MATVIGTGKSIDPQFRDDVAQGLGSEPKYLSPKYFYDARGDQLFTQIMSLPEYYLTRTEHGILSNFSENLLMEFSRAGSFTLVELGAGDGLKTKVLLRHFTSRSARFKYAPVDISSNALSGLVRSISAEFPLLNVTPLPGDYFSALERMKRDSSPKAVLFLGASIGNFPFDQALAFLNGLHDSLSDGDVALIGFDLKKNPHEILAAYNDKNGVTRDFNLNLLARINRELDGEFEMENYSHYPLYDPQSGEAKSFLVSLKRQSVRIGKLNKTFRFEEGEAIHTEISRKYSLSEIGLLAELSGFTPIRNFTDPKNRFVDVLWKR